ncbi:MAG TPA: dethiobiotin synthase, partial [Buchnera sp. (in: enterobacteria)]|nr:dethiobiotin synthase [Buchnera sp. (in: enterobacteria)]
FKKFSSVILSYKDINPFSFMLESSPHILSIHQNITIDFQKLSLGLSVLKKTSNFIIIEGAGGWYTPLSNIQTYADWVKVEKLPVILIVGIKLGCINHAILTQNAILSSNLFFSGWIANTITPKIKFYQETIMTLKKYLTPPLLGEIPYIKNINNISDININIRLPQ